MRKQLTVVTALAVVAASAAPAAARPDVPFPPGTSDAAQAGYESPPPARTAVATDLRGDAAREGAATTVAADLRGDAAREGAATTVAADLRGDAAREGAATTVAADLRGDAAREGAATTVAADLRGDAARAAAEPPVPVSVEVQAPAADGLDWTSVGLGAGGGLVAVLTAGGIVLIARRGVRVGVSR